MTRSVLRTLSGFLAGAVSVPVTAQAPQDVLGTGSHWRVESRAQIDLWFHGLAVIGYEGFAPLPLYSADYAERVRAAKRAAKVYPTPLDTLARRFRTGFEQDSVFEVLHFVPLYFAAADVRGMLQTVKAVSAGSTPNRLLTNSSTGFGARVLTTVIRQGRERQLLGEFAAALEQEWSAFYEAYRKTTEESRIDRLTAMQRHWDAALAPGLQPFLEARRAEAGIVFAAEALGPEGRIFEGNPRDPTDNVVAVRLLPDSDGAAHGAFAIVREICYPIVSKIVAQSGLAGQDRFAPGGASPRLKISSRKNS